MNDTGCIVVLVTASSREEAEKLAAALVDECLAACINIVGPIQSIYVWQGQRQSDEEFLLVIKTRAALFSELATRVQALHSYQTPEVIALPITQGSSAYLGWLLASTRA